MRNVELMEFLDNDTLDTEIDDAEMIAALRDGGMLITLDQVDELCDE